MADTIKFLKTIIDTNDSPYTTEYEVLSTLKEICPNEVYVFSQGTKTITTSALNNTQRSTLKYIGIPNSVTTIEEGAFQNCTNLLSIRIPDSVTSLGASAFSGCSKLTNAVLGQGITKLNKATFSNCTYLKSISMPKVTRAYSETFNNCLALQGSVYNNAVYVGSESNPYLVLLRPNVEPASLSKLTIHERTQIINNSALRECTNITGLQIPESVLEIGCNALSASGKLLSLRIPFVGKSKSTSLTAYEKSFGYIFGVNNTTTTTNTISVTNLVITSEMSINTKAFNGCQNLTNFTLGNVEDMSTIARSIGNQAFLNCTSLRQVILPNSVTTIGANAFSGCKNLQTVSIFTVGFDQQYKSQLYSIGNSAFDSCTSLTYLYFPAALTTINAWAFTNCTKLTDIAVTNDIPTIGRGAFNGTPYLTNSNNWEFPNNCQTVGSTIIAVNPSTSGTYRVLSDCWNRVYIGGWAFRNCSSITEIILPGCCTGTKSTHDACGIGCTYCDEYYSHCYKIGDYAFDGCSSLTRVCIPSTVTSIGTEAFSACPNIQEIEFYGTETEWDNITKANNWNSGYSIDVYPTI